MVLKDFGRRVVAAAGVMLLLTSCTSRSLPESQQGFPRAVEDAGAASLGDAVMAFFVGPQNDEMYSPSGEIHKPGYLVLVSGDGSYRAVETRRMDMMRPAWSGGGLFFADEGSDYRIAADGMKKISNKKVTAQNLMFVLPDGGSVGVYNEGHDGNGGYLNQVGVMTGGSARVHSVQGNYFTGALCDGQVFGMTSTPGTHAVDAPKTQGMVSTVDEVATPQMLTRLYPAASGETVVGWRPNFGSGTPIGQVPCHNKVITFLSWDVDAEGREVPQIVSWDTRNGRHSERRLTFDSATSLNLEDFGYVVQDWQGGTLHWVYADGRVFATDPADGTTSELFTTGLGTGSTRSTKSYYAFSDSRFHVLSTSPGGEGNLVYETFDRRSGDRLSRTPIAIANKEVNISYLNISHISVPAGQAGPQR